jgi:hypothetical protein
MVGRNLLKESKVLCFKSDIECRSVVATEAMCFSEGDPSL